ncbi:hypothetical protein DACRYDRAFT_106818 [Dacryopinax primogenitus]|uniref:Uncharacterized protein n=1 Tax=Dacryopinax primogenitus (strain DJM 731) TaxID=1858805 RepID=M5FXL4_DACPD|nr:uncharacterized protein DACRYDRAFT_106818 [Dacryopinax primogenitus]EJU02761.1 hypothetical protein DACRYDRAFT_106818 [Dacryopinax primogenitus]
MERRLLEYPDGYLHIAIRGLHLPLRSKPVAFDPPCELIFMIAAATYLIFIDVGEDETEYTWFLRYSELGLTDFLKAFRVGQIQMERSLCYCCMLDRDALGHDEAWFDDWDVAWQGLQGGGNWIPYAVVDCLKRLCL